MTLHRLAKTARLGDTTHSESSHKTRRMLTYLCLPICYSTNFVPTVDGANLPGITFSISYFALHPEQCPGISTRGFSSWSSATVSLIQASFGPTRWYPPTTAYNGTGTLSPASCKACLTTFTTPAWLHPVKTTSPLPAAALVSPQHRSLKAASNSPLTLHMRNRSSRISSSVSQLWVSGLNLMPRWKPF